MVPPAMVDVTAPAGVRQVASLYRGRPVCAHASCVSPGRQGRQATEQPYRTRASPEVGRHLLKHLLLGVQLSLRLALTPAGAGPSRRAPERARRAACGQALTPRRRRGRPRCCPRPAAAGPPGHVQRWTRTAPAHAQVSAVTPTCPGAAMHAAHAARKPQIFSNVGALRVGRAGCWHHRLPGRARRRACTQRAAGPHHALGHHVPHLLRLHVADHQHEAVLQGLHRHEFDQPADHLRTGRLRGTLRIQLPARALASVHWRSRLPAADAGGAAQ